MKKFILCVLLLCGAGMPLFSQTSQYSTQSSGVHWFTDYNEAKTSAKNSSKPMVLLFTGSDWCPACKTLKRDVFDSPEFARQLGDQFVFVMLDYPRGKAPDPKTAPQNEQLKNQYNITYYPTVIVLDENAKRIGEIKYDKGPQEFIRNLQNKVQPTQSPRMHGSIQE